MVARSHQGLINPRLGSYLAIFSSALVALVILLLIFSELGTDPYVLRQVMILGPVAIYVLIGMSCYAGETDDYFIASRAIPSFFNGLCGALTTLGGTGLVAIAGSLFLIGYDAFSVGIGLLLGVMVLVSLLVPYLRKYGGQTVPSYLGRRFTSRSVRMLSAILLSIPVMMLIVAELKVGSAIVSMMLGGSAANLVPVGCAIMFTTIAFGGMKGVTWSSCAQGVVVLFALLVPLVVLSTMMTNLPFAQITYGSILTDVAKLEAQSGLAARSIDALAINLPGRAPTALDTPFLAAFSNVGTVGFVLLALSVMTGVAALPSILMRAGTVPSVFEARKSMGWVAVIVGLILLSLPAYVVIARHLVLSDLVGVTGGQVPNWVANLQQLGLAAISGDVANGGLRSIEFSRDGALLVLPVAANFPDTVAHLVAAGVIAAIFAAATAHFLAVANMVTDDVILGLSGDSASELARAIVARVVLGVVVTLGGYLVLHVSGDPFRIMLLALSLAGSTGFVILVLSIWWKRLNMVAALVTMMSGFFLAGAYMFLTEQRVIGLIGGIDAIVVAAVVVPVTGVIAGVVSLLTEPPGRQVRDFVRDLRVPGGETVYDRERRMARGRRRRRQ
ncbi:MAG: hypothetical protein V3V97_01700 [Hyphomicrobiaceae bacterium]